MLAHWELLLRIATGAALGGVIGYERDRHGRPAGLRTHIIVALASATFMVVSSQFAYHQRFGHGDGIEVDGSRIAASVVSGIGFLAGGAILRTGVSIRGLTTAAGLWLVAAIGLCAGSGMYLESVYVTMLGLLALTLLRVLEDKKVVRRRVVMTFDASVAEKTADPFAAVSAELRLLHAKALDLDYHEDRAASRTSLSFDILFPDSLELSRVVSALDTVAGVREVEVRVP